MYVRSIPLQLLFFLLRFVYCINLLGIVHLLSLVNDKKFNYKFGVKIYWLNSFNCSFWSSFDRVPPHLRWSSSSSTCFLSRTHLQFISSSKLKYPSALSFSPSFPLSLGLMFPPYFRFALLFSTSSSKLKFLSSSLLHLCLPPYRLLLW